MASYKVHSRADNVRINKKFKNKQSGYRPKACQYGVIWSPWAYPSKYRKSKKNQELRKYYAQWVDCELHRDCDADIVLDHDDYDDIPIWTCSLCTYLNVERLAFCSMCNHPFNSNLVQTEITKSYHFKPSRRKTRKPKRKRNKKRKSKSNGSYGTDFETYWRQMSDVKKYQPKDYTRFSYQSESDVAKHKLYLSKVVLQDIYRTYNRYSYRSSFYDKLDTKIWQHTIEINEKKYNLILYQTEHRNKIYDHTNLEDILIVFDPYIFADFSQTTQKNMIDVARKEICIMLLNEMKSEKCEFAAENIPDATAEDDAIDFHGAYPTVQTAKYYREEAEENARKFIYRNTFKQNDHEMRVKVRLLSSESMLIDAIVDIDILDDINAPIHYEYECHSSSNANNVESKSKLHTLCIAQSCFNCKHPYEYNNTVVWHQKYHRYSLLNTISDHNIERELYSHFPCDVARDILKYLYYDAVIIVEGFVKKSWINFVGGTKYNDLQFAYEDSKGNVRYFTNHSLHSSHHVPSSIFSPMIVGNRFGEMDIMQWQWSEIDNESSTKSTYVIDLFAFDSSSSSDSD